MKRILVIVLMCLTVCLIGIGSVFIFRLNNQEKELPSEVTVYNIDNKHYVMCEVKEGSTYIYKIEQNFSQNKNVEFIETALIESDKNFICLNDYDEVVLKLGQYIKVSVSYKGEIDSGNSKFSDSVTYQIDFNLSTPVLNKTQVSGKDVLSWESIDQADFYTVYYQGSTGSLKSYTTKETTIDTSKLYGDIYTFSVVANSNKNYYKASNSSNVQNIKVTRKVDQFLYYVYNKDEGTLSLTSEEIVTCIRIVTGTGMFEADDKIFIHSVNRDGNYVYTIKNTYIYGNFKGASVSGYYNEYNTWSDAIVITQN
ncbi:MAG: hypothetical protein IJ008_00510 [Clostridia bacterium]|nr:hypothetical protein [Clostridia bacterium]